MADGGFSLNPGFFIGHYRIGRPLRCDSAGEVYLAKSSQTQRDCVFRLFPKQLVADPAFQNRLASLGPELTELQHPHIVRTHDIGEEFGLVYIAADSHAGESGTPRTLRQLLEAGPLPETRVRDMIRQLSAALEHAHTNPGRSIVHGRLTPDEVIVTHHERVKVAGMGLAELVGDEYCDAADCVSPERLRGAPLAPGTDIYSLGALIYHMLTGEPFATGSPPPSDFGLNPLWDNIMGQCLHPDPAARFQRASQLMEHIDELAASSAKRKRSLLVPVLAAVVILALAAVPIALKLRERADPGDGRAAALSAEAQAERDAADRKQRADGLVSAAGAALELLDYETAGEAARRALELDPGSAAAAALLKQIELALDPTTVTEQKRAAAAAWARVEKFDAGQGFDAALNRAWSVLKAADKAFQTHRYQDALDGYRKALAACQALTQLDARRRQVAPLRTTVQEARKQAWVAEAADAATETWTQAKDLENKAVAAFEAGVFDDAEKHWKEARKLFVLAQAHTKGADLAATARVTFEKKLKEADAAALREGAPGAWEGIEELAAQARQLDQAQDWPAAVRTWHAAAKLLAETDRAVLAAQRNAEFERAVTAADEAMATERWADAAVGYANALLTPGYEEHAEVKRKQRLALRRRQEGSDKSGQLDRYRAAPKTTGNLVPNGGFEQGKDGRPLHWTAPDHLTIFWENVGAKGKGLRLDTDVYRKEWEEHMKNPVPGKKKTITSGAKYNTVGGTVGVAVYSYGIPVEEDAWYRIEYDLKCNSGEPFIFLKGYWRCDAEDSPMFGKDIIFFKPDPQGPRFSLTEWGGVGQERHQPRDGDYMMSFKRRFVAKLPPNAKGKWHRYRGVVHLERKHHVEMVLLEMYAFWPPGEYFFDNVSMVKIPASEGEKFKEWRKKHPHGIPLER